ncbi:hypothetical protein WG936_08100 [Corynebacterium sp. H127]|uniref:hypothetical protein n=1 Tax=Corynebacterium sp. H127 TaxID=3133418 RepID=UPI003099CA8E
MFQRMSDDDHVVAALDQLKEAMIAKWERDGQSWGLHLHTADTTIAAIRNLIDGADVNATVEWQVELAELQKLGVKLR